MKFRHCIFLILLGFHFSTKAQQKQGQARLDSLISEVTRMKEDTNTIRLYDLISSGYSDVNSDEGLKWAEKQLILSRKIGWQRGEAMAFNNMGSHWEAKGAYAKAMGFFFKSLNIIEQQGNKYSIAVLTSNIGLLYQKQKQYEKSLQWNFKALKSAKEMGDSTMLQTIMNNIGMVYQSEQKYDEALKYHMMSLHIAESIHDEDVAGQFINIGAIFQSLKQYPAALAYTFRGLKIAEEQKYTYVVAAALGNAGENYYCIATAENEPQADSIVPASRNANLTKAIEYLRRSLKICGELQMIDAIAELTPYLSDALAAQGDYKGALAAYKDHVTARDSVFNAANAEHIASLETQRALQLKDKDIEIAKLAIAKKRNERVFFVSGIALLLIIMGVIVYNFRRHERNRRHIKALQDHKISLLDEAVKRRTEQLGSMRQTIATDFHDQTGNMLAAITRQAATLELKLLQQPEVLPLVRTIINNSNELYASSKDFLWNLNHDSDDPLVLFQYLSGYGQRFYNQFDISFSSLINGEAQAPIQLQPFAGLNLIYIFKEAMSNVIKHSGADEVGIELNQNDRTVTYSLQDNGTWKEADASIEHYGLSNMERRCKQSGFDYKLSHDTKGTRVEVTLPVNIGFINAPDPALPFNS
jgi:signal transduction histidine kinase